ncbi:MAG: Yip1 family protein [Paracoccaceae bacterium]
MDDTLKSLLVMARDTVTDPKEGARRVLSLPLPREALWQALALVVIISLLLTHLTDRLMPSPTDPLMPAFRDMPLLTVAILGGLTVLMVVAIDRVGRLMGGTGNFEGALRITIWLQFVMLLVQAVQVFFMVVFPPIAVLLGPLAFGLSLWLLTNFIAVLHGFEKLLPVFLMILVTALALGFALFFILTLAGVHLPTELTNV